MGQCSGVVVTTAALWQAGSIPISYCAEVAFPPWVCLGSRLGLRLPTVQRHTQRQTLSGLYTSLWVLVQTVVYLWMWPCDELPTCPGCDPVLAPSTAGIGSGTPCDPEYWLKWWLQLDGWMFYCLSMIYQGYLTYPLSLKACFKVVLILLLR